VNGVRALVVKPHTLSDPGLVGAHARELGFQMVRHVADLEGPPPRPDDFDFVIVMGSPWSVYGAEVEPWIEGVLDLIRQAVEREVPVLGICFGAQAFAQAMGGEVRKADHPEVGWQRVATDLPDLIEEGPWFMWHSDTFDLPPSARLLASTEASPQAYSLGRHLLVQFHPEVTAEILDSWIQEDPSDLNRQGIDPAALVGETAARLAEAEARAARLLDRFLGGAWMGPSDR
jgi:GMP synthase-like glutamine amidotransferase